MEENKIADLTKVWLDVDKNTFEPIVRFEGYCRVELPIPNADTEDEAFLVFGRDFINQLKSKIVLPIAPE